MANFTSRIAIGAAVMLLAEKAKNNMPFACTPAVENFLAYLVGKLHPSPVPCLLEFWSWIQHNCFGAKMIIKPRIRNNICLNSHPKGCAKAVESEIEYVKKAFAGWALEAALKPKLVLVIGCSTGYGLASRIAAAFGCGAATVGVSFETAGSEKKPGTPGFYNNLAFDKFAAKEGLAFKTLNIDAFSHEGKDAAIGALRDVAKAAGIDAKVDLIIYSLASPVRTDPKTGIMHRSVIKPIGGAYSGLTVDMLTGKLGNVSVEGATDEEAFNTVKVMGGEDWELWIDALDGAGVLSGNFKTVAYTYIGPELSWAIYKNGTIGRAKEDLERACGAINKKTGKQCAFVSVNKAVVTRSSAVIPIIPLYISCLFRVMKDMKLHEGCIEQICRLFKERLYTKEAASSASGASTSKVPLDEKGRIRIDDWEMRDDVQAATADKLSKINDDNIFTESDLAGFKHDFLEAHGFDIPGIDYDEDIDVDCLLGVKI